MIDRANGVRRRRHGSVSPEAEAYARKLLAQTLEYANLGKLGVATMRGFAPDGSAVKAAFDGTLPSVDITSPEYLRKLQNVTLSTLWAPRGFLVYPATLGAPRGYGLPVVQQGDNPFAPVNLAPGVDTTRWTPGGACGQVLLSRDANAGYAAEPLAQWAPITYTDRGATFAWNGPGSYDARPDTGKWAAYRMEASDFVEHYPFEDASIRRGMFAKFNAQRVAAGLDAAYMWPRGFYRPAESTSYAMAENGIGVAQSNSYPVGYRSPSERMSKDGYWTDVAYALETASAAGFGGVQRSYELQRVGSTTLSALSTWTFKFPASVNYTSPDAQPLFFDVGYRNGFWCGALQERDQWISAGRRSWQSVDTDLPPISWDAPPSLSLGFMTLPVGAVATSQGASVSFVLPNDMTSTGRFYLSHYQSTNGFRPLLGRCVFARGRAIARLPNNGFVMGAGIISTPDNDRLVVLGYHPQEQTGTWEVDGISSHIHAWYIDYPRTGTLRLHSSNVVCDTTTAPYAWKDGGVYVVPGIKYESLWEFAPDGQRAVCLRDLATAADYNSMATSAISGGFSIYVLTGSGKCAAVQLEFANENLSAAVVTTTLASQGPLQSRTASVLPHHPSGLPADVSAAENQLTPIAACYDSAGNIKVAYLGNAALFASGYVLVDGVTVTVSEVDYAYVGTGGTDAQWPSDLGDLQLVSSNARVPELDCMYVGFVQCADVRKAIFVVEGSSPKFSADYSSYDLNGGSPKMNYALSDTWPACMLSTSAAVHQVRMYKQGALLDASTYPHPAPDLWQQLDLPYREPATGGTHSAYVAPINWPSIQVQPFYAERFGEWITGYQIGAAAPVAYPDIAAACAPDTDQVTSAVSAQHYATFSKTSRSPVGGLVRASFSLPAGANAGWLNEALVV